MKKSAGILPYRIRDGQPEFFLVHPGGPFWKKKDAAAWSVAKGEYEEGEEPLAAARREFTEETGLRCDGKFIPLKPVKQKSGKQVIAWAIEMDIDPSTIHSNTFQLEWPPKSGRYKEFPEVDKGEWFTPGIAREKINAYQLPLIDELLSVLDSVV